MSAKTLGSTMTAKAFEVPFWWGAAIKDEGCKKFVQTFYAADDLTGLDLPEAELRILNDLSVCVSADAIANISRGKFGDICFMDLEEAFKYCSGRNERNVLFIEMFWASHSDEILSTRNSVNRQRVVQFISECRVLLDLMRGISAAVSRIA
jgi:hypothetical protein